MSEPNRLVNLDELMRRANKLDELVHERFSYYEKLNKKTTSKARQKIYQNTTEYFIADTLVVTMENFRKNKDQSFFIILWFLAKVKDRSDAAKIFGDGLVVKVLALLNCYALLQTYSSDVHDEVIYYYDLCNPDEKEG